MNVQVNVISLFININTLYLKTIVIHNINELILYTILNLLKIN